jgi:hypothetical protein
MVDANQRWDVQDAIDYMAKASESWIFLNNQPLIGHILTVGTFQIALDRRTNITRWRTWSPSNKEGILIQQKSCLEI